MQGTDAQESQAAERIHLSRNPCLSCGACCAHYCVSFYWGDADDVTPGGVPVDLTEDLNDMKRAMKGTRRHPPRCIALVGEIGEAAFCSIYERRPSPCRELDVSYTDGRRNERCDKARIAHALRPLAAADWAAGE